MNNLKSTKKELIVILMTAVSIFSSFAVARGTQGSGGGGGFDCYQADRLGSPRKFVYLLDLWEGENLPIGGPYLTIPRSSEPVEVQFDRAAAKLHQFDSSLPAQLKEIAGELFRNKVETTSDVELPFPSDALTKYTKKDCRPVGIMYFDGEIGKLVYEKKYFDFLKDNTEIAATMFHEAWYKLVRDQAQGVKIDNSINTRKLTACVFSTSTTCLDKAKVKLEPRQHLIEAENDDLVCRSSNSRVSLLNYLGHYTDPHMIIQIEKLANRRFVPFFRKMNLDAKEMIAEDYYLMIDKYFPLSQIGLKQYDLVSYAKLPKLVLSANHNRYVIPLVYTGRDYNAVKYSKPLYVQIYDQTTSNRQIIENTVQPIDSLICD